LHTKKRVSTGSLGFGDEEKPSMRPLMSLVNNKASYFKGGNIPGISCGVALGPLNSHGRIQLSSVHGPLVGYSI